MAKEQFNKIDILVNTAGFMDNIGLVTDYEIMFLRLKLIYFMKD